MESSCNQVDLIQVALKNSISLTIGACLSVIPTLYAKKKKSQFMLPNMQRFQL